MWWARLAIVIPLLFRCAHLAAESVQFPAGQSEVRIQLTRCGDLLFVPAKLNGSDPVLLLLDTGSSVNCLEPAFAKRSGFSKVSTSRVNATQVDTVLVPQIDIGGVKFAESTAILTDLSRFKGSPRGAQLGTIGGTILRCMPYSINWSKAVLTLHRDRPTPPQGAEPLPMWVFADRPYVSATPGGDVSGWFGIDTGAECGFGLEASYARWNLSWLAPLRYRIVPGSSFNSTVNYFSCRLPDAKIGGMPVAQSESYYPVDFERDTAFPPPAHGYIGQEILKRFELTFDYGQGKVWLVKDPADGVPAEWSLPDFDPRRADPAGITPLFRAAAMGRAADVKRFIAHGADPTAKGPAGKTPLHESAGAAVVDALIAGGVEANARSDAGWTPLHRIAWSGNAAAVQALLKYRVNVDARDKLGTTPLIYAACSGDIETVSALIQAGANLEIADGDGTALSAACMYGHAGAARVLLDAGAKLPAAKSTSSSIISAATWGSVDLVEQLLAAGADVNSRTADGMSTLMVAATQHNTEVVQLLLDRGANASLQKDGATALHYALHYRQLPGAKIIYFHPRSAIADPTLHGKPEQLQFPGGKTQVLIPLKRASDRLLVPVKLNGQNPQWFFLDTAASGIMVDQSLADEYKLPQVISGTIGGNGVPFVAVSEIEVGGVKLHRTFADAVDVDKRAIMPGLRSVRGILGGDFLRQMPFAIDWSAPSLTLYRNKPAIPDGSVRVPLWLLDNRPAMHLSLKDNISGWFVCNHGAELGFELAPDFVGGAWGWLSSRSFAPDLMMSGEFSRPHARRSSAVSVSLAGLKTLPAELHWADSSSNTLAPQPPAAGSIGNQVLKHFEVVFDYSAKSAWLKLDSGAAMPAEWENADFDAASADSSGFTPLMRAAKMGTLEGVRRFIAAGANVRAADFDGNTAVHFASQMGDANALKVLLDAGASVNASNRFGVTPLIAAAASGHSAAVRLLLDRGADAKAADQKGNSALTLATLGKHFGTAGILVGNRIGSAK